MKILYLPNQYSQQRQFEKPVWVYPVRMAMEATYLRDVGHEVKWISPGQGYDLDANTENIAEGIRKLGVYDEVVTQPKGIDFLSLPIPDRIWTMAHSKRYQVYGNYKYRPATHMQVAGGCWHGQCTFCVEQNIKYEVRSIDSVMKELEICEALGFREVFDDSATFPTGKWLDDFRREKRWKHPRIKFGCNMRVTNELIDHDMYLMKQAGFRMILIGVESARQSTLNKIKKGIRANEIIPFFKKMSDAGLEPHAAVMFGYPWADEEEDLETLGLVHFLLRKGYAKTAQASIYTHAGRRGLDRGIAKRVYDVWKYSDFWVKQLQDIREWEDIVYLFRKIKKGIVRD